MSGYTTARNLAQQLRHSAGDTPYDATAARKAGIATIGVLCGGFTEQSLSEAGCVEVYPGPGALFACFEQSPLAS